MKNKSDIFMYVAAIVGGVLGAYLFASRSSVNNDNSALGFIVNGSLYNLYIRS